MGLGGFRLKEWFKQYFWLWQFDFDCNSMCVTLPFFHDFDQTLILTLVIVFFLKLKHKSLDFDLGYEF